MKIELKITEVIEYDDSFNINGKEYQFAISKQHKIIPQKGDVLTIYLHQLGNILIIVGVDLNGIKIFRKTSNETNEQILKSDIVSKIPYFN